MNTSDKHKAESIVRNKGCRRFTGFGLFMGYWCKFRDGKIVSAKKVD